MRPALAVFAILATAGLEAGSASSPDTPAGAAQTSDGGNAASGAAKAAACLACHSADGKSSSPDRPRLAGLSAVYIAGQLRLFRSGARNHPAMKSPAAGLTDQDIDDLAVYYAAPATTAAAANGALERKAEQQLRLQGYKPTRVNGETIYCKREAPMGSRLVTTVHCLTTDEAEMIAKEGRETTERLQRGMTACLNPAQGGCGR